MSTNKVDAHFAVLRSCSDTNETQGHHCLRGKIEWSGSSHLCKVREGARERQRETKRACVWMYVSVRWLVQLTYLVRSVTTLSFIPKKILFLEISIQWMTHEYHSPIYVFTQATQYEHKTQASHVCHSRLCSCEKIEASRMFNSKKKRAQRKINYSHSSRSRPEHDLNLTCHFLACYHGYDDYIDCNFFSLVLMSSLCRLRTRFCSFYYRILWSWY